MSGISNLLTYLLVHLLDLSKRPKKNELSPGTSILFIYLFYECQRPLFQTHVVSPVTALCVPHYRGCPGDTPHLECRVPKPVPDGPHHPRLDLRLVPVSLPSVLNPSFLRSKCSRSSLNVSLNSYRRYLSFYYTTTLVFNPTM